MYKYILLLLSFGWLISCQNGNGEAYPKTLEGKKQLLSEKKASLLILESEIELLNDEIAEMDPSLIEKARLVTTSLLQPELFERYIDIQGIVVSDDVVNVVSEVPGRITTLTVKEGDYIKKGQLVATLDLETINKQIVEVETALQLATDVFERQSRLWNQNIGSEIQYLEAKNSKERLEKNLETLNFQMTKSMVYSPISGTVDMEITKSGEFASPGVPIVRILNLSKIKVEADLPEKYLTIVRRGLPVEVSFPSLDQTITGRISLLGRSIDPANRTLKIEISLSRSAPLLKPNLLAEIKLKELESKDAIVIPVEFVLQEVDGSEFVYLAETSETGTRAKKVYVTTGEAFEGRIVVDEGLESKAELITKGARTVSDGELIEITNTSIVTNE